MSNDLNNLLNIVESMEFVPSDAQIRAKAKVMAVIADNPVYSAEDMTLEVAIEFTKERRMRQWWKQDGFQDWFKNRHEFRAEVEDLLSLGLRRIRAILVNDDTRLAGPQMSAIKMLMEVSNKMPKENKQNRFMDDSIAKMDALQLEEFLTKAGYAKIPAPQDPKFLLAAEDADSNTIIKEGATDEDLPD